MISVFFRPVVIVGAFAMGLLDFLGGLGLLLLDTARAVPEALFSKRGLKYGWKNLWIQMDRVGVRSIPIIFLVTSCIGAILALQMAPTLRMYGQVNLVANIVSIAVFRELGPLISAVVLNGFAGASIAAELGTMVVSEEVEALHAEAIDPVRFLVVPRVVATTIMMFCLAVVGDLSGILGGMFTSSIFLGINYTQYLNRTFEQIKSGDFLTGLVKAAVFGTLIAGLACYQGLSVTGGAQGVGVATTRTVVRTIIALIIVDLMFTASFYYLGF